MELAWSEVVAIPLDLDAAYFDWMNACYKNTSGISVPPSWFWLRYQIVLGCAAVVLFYTLMLQIVFWWACFYHQIPSHKSSLQLYLRLLSPHLWCLALSLSLHSVLSSQWPRYLLERCHIELATLMWAAANYSHSWQKAGCGWVLRFLSKG